MAKTAKNPVEKSLKLLSSQSNILNGKIVVANREGMLVYSFFCWGLGGEWNKNSELQIEVKQVWEGKNRVLFSEKIRGKDVQ